MSSGFWKVVRARDPGGGRPWPHRAPALAQLLPKAFANLPLNILLSRDHSKCHFWPGNQLHRAHRASRLLHSKSRRRASRKPAGLESCRPGTMFCVCHCLTCREVPSPYPRNSPT